MTAVRVEGISKLFGRQRALSGVSLELAAGRVCALLGANGAGKSTLIGVVATLVRPTTGRVVFAGGAPVERGVVGLLGHEAFVYGDLDAMENLAFWGALYDLRDVAARATALLDDLGLDAAARKRPARTYSRGMLQRLALARALLPAPRVLLLDEPFTGLDRRGAQAVRAAVERARDDGRVVLCATHDVESLDGVCGHVVVLRAGKVVLDEQRADGFSLPDLRERAQAG